MVPGVGDDELPSPADVRCELVRDVVNGLPVFTTDYDQRRHKDVPQSTDGRWVQPLRIGRDGRPGVQPRHHHAGALTRGRIDLVGTTALSVGPDLQAKLDGAVDVALLPRLLQRDDPGRRGPRELIPGYGGSDEDQPAHQVGVRQRQVNDRGSAARTSHQEWPLYAQDAEQRTEILVEGERLCRLVRTAEAAGIVADDAELPSKLGELSVPLAAVDQVAVHHHQGGSDAGDLIPEPGAVHLGNAFGRGESVFHLRCLLGTTAARSHPVTLPSLTRNHCSLDKRPRIRWYLRMSGAVPGFRARASFRRYQLGGGLRWLRRRTRYVAVLGTLGACIAVLLLVGYHTAGNSASLALSVAASLIIVIATYLIFNPVLEGIRAATTREHPRLDLEEFTKHIADASNGVDILDTWTRLLEGHIRDRFFAAVRDALEGHVTIRILLLDPESKAAEQRAEEIGHHADVPRTIMETLFQLDRFRQNLSTGLRDSFDVRVYSASPSVQLYRWDDRALFSFFPIGRSSHETPKLETQVLTPWGQFVQGRFEELWHDTRTLPLQRYMYLPLEVAASDTTREQMQVRFVWFDGLCYVSEPALLRHIARHGIRSLSVHPDMSDWRDANDASTAYALKMLDEITQSSDEISEKFRTKYGSAHEIILVLVPDAVSVTA